MSASSKKKLRKENAAAQLTEKQRQEQAEAKKLRNISFAFTAIMLVVALTAISVLAVRAVNNSGIIDRNTIAAVAGEHELNSVQVNYYFNDFIRNQYQQWKSSFGSSAATYIQMSMGLDINKPLDEQVQNKETGETWADHYLHEVLETIKSDYALYDMAMAENFQLSEEEQKNLEYNETVLNYYATLSGYKNAKQYLKAVYGHGADVESYNHYMKVGTIASAYYNKYREELKYDDAAIRARDEEHPNEYSSFSFAYYYASSSSYLTGGTKDDKGNTTYSDEERAAALKAAEDDAKVLVESTDLAHLDKAIAALEINKEKQNVTSTKYENTLYSGVPAVLQEWLANKDRKEGDIAIVPNESTTKDDEGNETKTTNGYYVVLFQGRNENLRHLANVRHLLVQFEGGTTGSDGTKTYSEEEKAAAKAEAEKYMQTWKDGEATEESFIALVKEHSDDGSAAEGGLFEDIHPASSLVESFRSWAIDSTRKPGDTGVIVSEFGYHVMYYVGDGDLTYRDYMISEELRSEDVEKWMKSVTDAATITTGKTNRLNLDAVLAFM